MNLHDFIFSDKRDHRLMRHLVFWTLWWLYFTVSYYHYQQTGLHKVWFENFGIALFIKSFLLLVIHISTCYVFIYYMLPRHLLRGRYFALIPGIAVLSVILILTSYFTHLHLYPLVDSLFDKPVAVNPNIWWSAISSGLLSAPKVITVATAIKLIKRWYLKQKEKERLEKEKLKADLELLKAQIKHEFLFSSLDSIYSFAQTDSFRASHLLLKLSDILSYTLYETGSALVALDKEISLIKDYMAVVKTKLGTRLEMDISVKGDTTGKMIPPMLLLPFIEHNLSHCGSGNCWMNIELQVNERELTLKLINGSDDQAADFSKNGIELLNVKKRLDILYPDNYEFKTSIEPDLMMTCLKIKLMKQPKQQQKIMSTETL
ncbi:MAG: histidine kinase [Bacteroidota bacterium]|nr:histidine kinase [Bacteroidota bacterium]